MATKQEIFDTVARHLLTQNARAEDEGGDCLYRTPEGLMCAAGCLIPDAAYSRDIEKKNVTPTLFTAGDADLEPGQIKLRAAMVAAGVNNKELAEFVNKLQHIHDHMEVYEWRMHLTLLACVEGLSLPDVLEAA
jgi:hypothetical protein